MRWTTLLACTGCAVTLPALAGCGDDHTPADPDAAAVDAADLDAPPPDTTPDATPDAPADAETDAPACANLLTDLGGACMSTPVPATTPSPETPNAEVAWTGTALAIAWVDRDGGGARRIFLTLLDPGGTPLGTVQLSEGSGDVYNPAIAWSGTELGVTWTTSTNTIYFVRATAAGARIGTPAPISEAGASAQGVAIAWGGDRYGLAWHDQRDGNSEIYFAAVDAAGSKLTADVRVTSTAARSWIPALVWTGSKFAIAYREDASTFSGRVSLALVDGAGAGTGGVPISDTGAWIGDPSLVWTGARLVAAWDDNRATDRNIYVQYLDGDGAELGADLPVTSTTTYSDEAQLAWDGAGYRMIWQEDLATGPFAVEAVDLDGAGARQTVDVELAQSGLSPAQPRILWLGDRHAVFWQVAIDSNTRQLLYATLTPP